MPRERKGNNQGKRKRNPAYAGTAKSMFNEIESVMSFVLTQESLRIDRDIKTMSNEMEKMHTANKNIKDLIEVINKDISENTNNSDKGNQVIEVLKKIYYLNGKLDDISELANVDLQNILQKQQQTLQMVSNISKMLYDTARSIIRKIGS